MGPYSNETVDLIKRKKLGKERHTRTRIPWEDKGRHLQAREHQRLLANHEKLEKRHGQILLHQYQKESAQAVPLS